MSFPCTTSTLLLEGLAAAGDQTSWADFDSRYRPIVLAVLRRMGLEPNTANDVAQDTMLHFLRDFRAGKYDRTKGRLRSWLCAIARNRVHDHRKARQRADGWRGDSAFDELPSLDRMEDHWDQEARQAILRQALDMLRQRTDAKPETVRAFERYALEGEAPSAVAADLGLTVNAVYLAKHHCLRHLRSLTEELEKAHDA
ncbi:MAG: sigma-70 family RNA polymerase sigma factor [Planctomycetota bacterium]